jgi:hypothetical protein
MPTRLTNEIITAAILGFEEQKRHLDSRIRELRSMRSGGADEPEATPEPPARKRRMSAAGRRAMAEAMRKRWAEAKKVTAPALSATPKLRRRLSAAGRAAIIAATKKRWALKRAEAAKAERAAKKAARTRKKVDLKRVAVKAAPIKAAK